MKRNNLHLILFMLMLLSMLTMTACGNKGGGGTATHLECQQSTCVEVNGKGLDTCAVSTDCGGYTNGPDLSGLTPGNTIFGMNGPHNTLDKLQQAEPYYTELGITHIRIWEDWGQREPSKGTYKWEALDSRINYADEQGYSVFLTLKPVGTHGDEIMWYCKPETANLNSCVFTEEGETEFRKYVELLMTRYAGKIDKIAFSNEWDSTWHFVGSAEEFTTYSNEVYDITKEVSPGTEVVIGAMTKNPFRYAALCEYNLLDEAYLNDGTKVTGSQLQQFCSDVDNKEKFERVKYVLDNAKYDYLDIHLYDDPEYWAEYVRALKLMAPAGKPILSSEFGGPRDGDKRYTPEDETWQASELVKYMQKLVELDFVEAYYFKLVQYEGVGIGHPLTGLMKFVDGKIIKKPNYEAFKDAKMRLEG